MDFSVILQDPRIRSVVQDGILERSFHDALFPNLLFRGEAMPVKFAGGIGDSMTFTGAGLIPTDGRSLPPGKDPTPSSYDVEHWTAMVQQYGGTIPTHMPSSVVAIVDLMLRNTHQLGLSGGATLDKKVRNSMYNAAMGGWTNVIAQLTTTTLHVARLNGLTRARNTTTGNFETVSPTNPLAITYNEAGTATANTIVGYASDANPDGSAGGEIGPGVITLGTTVTTVPARSYIQAVDRGPMVLAGGGRSIDDLGTTDQPTLANIRAVIGQMRTSSVPVHPDGRYHGHLSPTSEGAFFGDNELQRLNIALPDYFIYKDFALSEIQGCVLMRNSLCPSVDTVNGGSTAAWDNSDDFGGELYTTGATTGLPVQRILISGQGGVMEYYLPLDLLLSDAGITGKIAEPSITNNGIEIMTDRIQLLIRSPLNLMQDMIFVTWKFIGDWPTRTDALAIGPQRKKRFGVICHT